MGAPIQPLSAKFICSSDSSGMFERVLRFRANLFVGELGWRLSVSGGLERDEFDTDNAEYCILCHGSEIVGCFRAIRTDRPYLAQSIFPTLAEFRPYPTRSDMWEISRFGVSAKVERFTTARVLYGLTFRFGFLRRAAALVAITDLNHERFLQLIGIRTRRYGHPQSIGEDNFGRLVSVVAGETPLGDQVGSRVDALLKATNNLEVSDETLVFGRKSLSA